MSTAEGVSPAGEYAGAPPPLEIGRKNMDDPKPIIVACQCGWQGDQRDVISIKHSATRYCPVCGRLFRQWPPNNANQQIEGEKCSS